MASAALCSSLLLVPLPLQGQMTAGLGTYCSCGGNPAQYRVPTESVPLPSRFGRGRTQSLSGFAKTAEHKHGGDLLGKRARGPGQDIRAAAGMRGRGAEDSGTPGAVGIPRGSGGPAGAGGPRGGRRPGRARGRCPRC